MEKMMNKAMPFSRLPRAAKEVVNRIERVVFGFDRLTLWVDHPDPDLQLNTWQKYCHDVTIQSRSAKFHPAWQIKIEIHQPSKKALRLLSEVIGDQWNTKLSYAEVAIDWLTVNPDGALEFYAFLLGHLYVKSTRDKLYFCESTAYFGSRTSEDGKKTPHNVALYADRPSKLYGSKPQGAPCCHLEHRFSGVGTLDSMGLATVHDCAAFSHRKFWTEHLQLRTYSITKVGQLAEPTDTHVSTTTLRNRGRAVLHDHTRDGVPILQNVLVELREVGSTYDVQRMLKPIDNQHFLRVARTA